MKQVNYYKNIELYFIKINYKEVILKIKDTLKELEKYESRVKSPDAFININKYTQDLNIYLNKYNVLQVVLRELDCLENKDFSSISRRSNEKMLQNYESDSNSHFLGTPPRKGKISNKISPCKIPLIEEKLYKHELEKKISISSKIQPKLYFIKFY